MPSIFTKRLSCDVAWAGWQIPKAILEIDEGEILWTDGRLKHRLGNQRAYMAEKWDADGNITDRGLVPNVLVTLLDEDTSRFKLCDVCQKLDLSATNNRKAAKYSLGTVSRITGNLLCPFCRTVAKIHNFQDEDSTEQVFIEWNLKQGFRGLRNADNLVFLNEETSASPYGSARRVQPQIDPALIKKWLLLCERLHEACTPVPVIKTLENPSGLEILRCIDVQDQCIVEAAPGVRYVALSYVWGQTVPAVRLQRDNKTQLEAKGGMLGIRQVLPRTINDAIDLVGLIGERYLWIDSLCLVQDDRADMAAGISKMDLVYQGSLFTIIAAHGEDADAGLPGLQPGSRRVKQRIVEMMPGIEMTFSRGVYDALTVSRHVTRGWTMQELALSHRTVIFCDNGIWFRCRENCWGEDTLYDKFPTEVIPNEMLSSGSEQHFLPDKNPWPLGSFHDILFRYSERKLTKESDAINAMAGVLRRLSIQMKSGLLEGIPTTAFDIYLLFWDNFPSNDPHSLGRRYRFPSWSWAGWRGGKFTFASYLKALADDGDINAWLRTMTYIVWYKRSPGGGDPELVWSPESQAEHGDLGEEDIGYRFSKSGEPYGRDIDPALKSLNTIPSADFPKEIIDRDYHLLHFWAYTVRFPAFEAPDGKKFQIPDSLTVPAMRIYTILGAGNAICGGMKLDDPRFLIAMDRPYEAVLLCKANRYQDLFAHRLNVEKPFYMVMLLEWQDPECIVAERRGMGFVFLDCIEHMLQPGKLSCGEKVATHRPLLEPSVHHHSMREINGTWSGEGIVGDGSRITCTFVPLSYVRELFGGTGTLYSADGDVKSFKVERGVFDYDEDWAVQWVLVFPGKMDSMIFSGSMSKSKVLTGTWRLAAGRDIEETRPGSSFVLKFEGGAPDDDDDDEQYGIDAYDIGEDDIEDEDGGDDDADADADDDQG
ncbi:heterokaryon incompatibility protein-domain-containing protein [Flammula alnicola]|nr:heterokaryon incompatibility protein-domain-containing protein [Flammula alnicola]